MWCKIIFRWKYASRKQQREILFDLFRRFSEPFSSPPHLSCSLSSVNKKIWMGAFGHRIPYQVERIIEQVFFCLAYVNSDYLSIILIESDSVDRQISSHLDQFKLFIIPKTVRVLNCSSLDNLPVKRQWLRSVLATFLAAIQIEHFFWFMLQMKLILGIVLCIGSAMASIGPAGRQSVAQTITQPGTR